MRLILFFLLLFVNENYGARILGLFPFQGKSHWVMFESIMKELAAKGHTVDVVNHFPQKKPIPRYTDISVKGSLPTLVNNLTMEVIKTMTIFGCIENIITQAGTKVCGAVLDQPLIKELYKSNNTQNYDLIITEIFGTDCMLAFAHKFQIPTVGLISSVSVPWSNDRFGNPDNPSFIPNYFLSYTENMNIFQRIVNTFMNIYAKHRFYKKSTLETEQLLREKLDKNIPSLYSLENNMSLMIVNSHFSINGARPLPPNVIEVAGLHVGTPTGKLPPNLEKIYNEAKNGVIYFCLGSMIRTETFTVDKQRALLDAFGELPYTVIWKGERDKFPTPIPKNVKFETWLPQLEILCNSKTKVFITHGGLMGTQEAIMCGTPMVGIPFVGDEELNIGIYAERGIVTKLAYMDITKEAVLKALEKVLYDPSYTQNMKRLSELYRDRPMSAMDTAIYWIEYVIRHKGAPHLRPYSVNLSWYQSYLYDILLVLFISLILILRVIYMLLKSFLKKLNLKNKRRLLRRKMF